MFQPEEEATEATEAEAAAEKRASQKSHCWL